MTIQPKRDIEGYLLDPDEWNEQIATELAREEGITLNQLYWSILQFMREYYNEKNIAPDVRHLIRYLSDKNSSEKAEAKQLIFKLFPYGYVKQACKIAGMKRPRAWSTG